MHVNYLITVKMRIKDIVYCINNQKVMYFVNFHNHKNLTKIMKRMLHQMRKLYSYDDVRHHAKRIQIIDRYEDNGNSDKRSVDYKRIHDKINEYMQTVKEVF